MDKEIDMQGIKIINTGYQVPKHQLTNDDLSQMVDTNDEWIYSRTGIKKRHICQQETLIDLAYQASLKAIEGIDREQIGIVIVATMSSIYNTPSVACLIQKRLGLNQNIVAFDLNAACSGFVYALSVGRALLKTQSQRYALIIGAEQLSSMIDWKDRSTCVLFGDGAGAVLIESHDQLYADYHGCEGNENVLYGLKKDYLHMEGREVFKFATKVLPLCIEKVLEKTSLTLDDIDYFIVHQANERIIRHVYKKMNIDPSKFYINVSEYGNTSAASIPLVLGEMNEKKLLKRGMKIVCVGFGAGLTYGANLIEW